MKKVGDEGTGPAGENGAPVFHSWCRCRRRCQGEAGMEWGVFGMERGVTGIVNGAGRVIGGGLDPQELEEMSGF